ncbi:MAG: acetylornithine/N-succinyldiaminopimelate aminotransferase [Actinomycetota bacterium]|nr:acetylornithine/N-succinyldiaminopimelate aminotransferase [Actinomycetota bacterium]
MTVLTPGAALMNTYKRWPVRFESGSGARLIDDRGNTYIDMIAGIAVNSLGHAHPALTEAIAEQAGKLIHISNLYSNAPQEELSRKLAEMSGGFRSFFCNSGAEAVECAVKLVRKWAGLTGHGFEIVCAEGGFHGRTFGALSATGQPGKKKAFEPLVPGFVHIPFGDIEAVKKALGAGACAVLLEPIQGEAGVIVPPRGYLGAVRKACDDAGALLILDEVQTGVGRTGSFFAFEQEGIVPDVVCLAKGLASGLPIGACLATEEVASSFVPGDHATTFGGGPLVSRAACVVIDIVSDDGFLDRIAEVGSRLMKGLGSLWPTADVRGRGLLIGVDLHRPAARALVEAAFDRNLLINDATDSVVRLAPPLVVTPDDVDASLAILEEVRDATR